MQSTFGNLAARGLAFSTSCIPSASLRKLSRAQCRQRPACASLRVTVSACGCSSTGFSAVLNQNALPPSFENLLAWHLCHNTTAATFPVEPCLRDTALRQTLFKHLRRRNSAFEHLLERTPISEVEALDILVPQTVYCRGRWRAGPVGAGTGRGKGLGRWIWRPDPGVLQACRPGD